jgi:hypothetical protein
MAYTKTDLLADVARISADPLAQSELIEQLDDMVIDLKTQEASNINNGSIDHQLDYLIANGFSPHELATGLSLIEAIEWDRWSGTEYAADSPDGGPYFSANVGDLRGRVWRGDDDDAWQWDVTVRGNSTPEGFDSEPTRQGAMARCEESLRFYADAIENNR